MSKMLYILIINYLFCSGVNFFWDLGVGIANFSAPTPNQHIALSTYHRVTGLKKYYADDYNAAIYHFKKLNPTDLENVLYECADSYYALSQPMAALALLDHYANHNLSDNLIYLKSQIYISLNNYNQALNELNYLITRNQQSDYTNIIRFDIEKLNLLINE